VTVSGWLFDIYPLADRMIIWIKQEKGYTIRLQDNWSHSIYVASNYKADFKSILEANDIISLIKEYEFTSCYERIVDTKESEVLKLTLSDSTKALTLAKRIEALGDNKFGKYRLYNVDLLPAQSYFYEHDIFPLAFSKVKVVINEDGYSQKLKWIVKENEDVWSTDYKIPDLKTIHMTVNIKKEGRIPRYSDKIQSITIKQQDNENIEIRCNDASEADTVKELETEISNIDPDYIFTEDGDSFTFPYLIYRAEQNDIDLILSRESIKLNKPAREGISYFSYGRVYFRPTTIRLYGRVHLDKSNSFVWNESGLQGLYEIARVCRMPLHTASRASIGKCLSSLQFYYAVSKKQILIPWKPVVAEHFKTLEELLIADRGGCILEPEIGVNEQVAEFDFESLYPNIMLEQNLSAETIGCDCRCYFSHNSKLRRVPELDYHICQKRIGIVPTSLKILLEKRAKYKQLLKSNTGNQELKSIYDARQSSLKWVLVTSFGYLGFNNAKFGRIDAHIGVCAFDRQVLLRAAKIVEARGFSVLHGIVDSLWLKNKNGSIKTEKTDYLQLKEFIEMETGFKISFEGIYKWIAFIHSKRNNVLPVPNRYFGVFEDGSLKIRGLEARRHDTPTFFSKCQNEILEIMSAGNTVNEVKALILTKVKDIFQSYIAILREKRVPLQELIFTKRLSKNSNEYYQNRNTIENNALRLLETEGKSPKAGEMLQYIITDYSQKHGSGKVRRRAVPIELINEKTTYDITRYTELLVETCNSVTEPFGHIITYTNNQQILH
jgi:DNA polymerase elongation subunit (family B)